MTDKISPTAAKVERRKIEELKPHPRQAAVFRDTDDAKLHELAAQLKERGFDRMVEITSDGTIIKGHRRVCASRLNGWTEIDVRVRYDLEAQGPDAVELAFLDDNLNDVKANREFDPLDKARCYQARMVLMRRLHHKRQGNGGMKGTLRDIIGAALNKSGRTLDRWLRVLKTPVEMQHAVSEQTLPLTTALKVASLPKEIQDKIAEAIRAGDMPKVAVAACLPKGDKTHRKIGDAAAALVRGARAHLADLGPRVDRVPPLGGADRAVLRKLHALLDRLLHGDPKGEAGQRVQVEE